MADYVFTSRVNVLGTNYMFICQSDGEVTLYDKKKDIGWGVTSEVFEKDKGVEYLRNLVRKYYDLLYIGKIDEWFRKTGLNWKKKY